MEIGLYTFANITAEDAGLDVFGAGEHHRLDLAISSPAVLLAAIGATTRRIRLLSAVTILSTLDPVRVFEDFATADLCASGRVELIVGRGAFTDSSRPKASYALDVPRETFDQRALPTGPLFVGSPQEIVDKIGYERELFGHERFLAQIDLGAQPYAVQAEVIELLATQVAPALRQL